jgi:putative transposase
MAFFIAPRLATFDYRGLHHYFLTICTLNRRPRFTSEAAVESVHAQLVRTSSLREIGITAYCYMPDHLHVLAIGLRADTDLRSWVQLFKQCSGYVWKQRNHGEQLWQRSYYDRVLRNEEDSAVIARYLLMNPVRRGLCLASSDYPYLGSLTHDVASLIAAAHDAEGGWKP